jgi:CsoR family transcriptional regulator, copper-sensing transcriptional repressor
MTHHKKPEISKRLARIEGHVRGIQRMVNEDKTYADIARACCACSSRWCDRSDGSGLGRTSILSQTRDERGRKVAIELKDTVSNIF